MNKKTKILVIRKKEVIIGSIVAIAALIALIFFIITFFNKSEADNIQNVPKQNSSSQNINQNVHNNLSGSSSTSLLDATMSGQPESASDNSAGTQPAASTNSSTNNQSANSTVTNSDSITYTYTPGVYTASMSLNGNPVDIQVTVDKHNINSIDLVQVSDAVTTMYPMLTDNFEQLSVAVMENGSTKNITYDAENKYTSMMLLNAIQAALDKCTVK